MSAYAIILAGGSGERLWPLSTPVLPKQFVSLFGGRPLITHAVERITGLIPPERTFVITASRLVQLTRKALPGIPRANIVGEPCSRDTAAAVAVACGIVKKHGGDSAVGCVLTADHLITPVAEFRKTLKDAVKAAEKTGSIVTIGVEPDRPAVEFGYVECAGEVATGTKTGFNRVKRFVEKPDAAKAAAYLKSGRYRWNSGMFIWRADVLESEFSRSAPELLPLIGRVARLKNTENVLKKDYPPLRKISFDYAVMEKARDVIVAKSGFVWDDVGSWLSASKYLTKDTSGNVEHGNTSFLDVSDSIVVGTPGHLVAMIGVKDLVVVHTAEATLVCAKDRVQDIKKLLADLRT